MKLSLDLDLDLQTMHQVVRFYNTGKISTMLCIKYDKPIPHKVSMSTYKALINFLEFSLYITG